MSQFYPEDHRALGAHYQSLMCVRVRVRECMCEGERERQRMYVRA
jgi:hypothetical protein